MSKSVIQFTQDFAKLKSAMLAEPSADQRLMTLAGFWENLRTRLATPGFESFKAEYSSLTSDLVTPVNLQDLQPEELETVLTITRELRLTESSDAIIYRLASVYCWLGELRKAAELLADQGQPEVKLPDGFSDLPGQTEYELLLSAIDRIRDSVPAVAEKLTSISNDWAVRLRELRHDRVNCLFVEMAEDRRAFRARMRVLEGRVEQLGGTAQSDEVAFDNQVKTPDDPFVGSVYDALQAIHTLMPASGSKSGNQRPYHAHYRVTNATHHFTGDSVTLAAALVAYTQLLRPSHSREERYLPLELAVTGGVNSEGNVTAVNAQTVALKVMRAFFSRLRILVVPEGNEVEAHEVVERLREKYPRRKLRIISAESLEDVVSDLNVVREEKVCIGEYVARSVYRYSRAARLQVPLLLVLIYVSIVLIYPKAWPWFDRNPAFVNVSGNRFDVFNAGSTRLWGYEFDCKVTGLTKSYWKVVDIDADGGSEVIISPNVILTEGCSSNSRAFVFDADGDLLNKLQTVTIGEYPNDNDVDFPYIPAGLSVVGIQRNQVLITKAVASNPARLHLKFWTASGELLGWYIHSGFGGTATEPISIDTQGNIALPLYNNRLSRMALMILNPHHTLGVSPPYDSAEYDLRDVKRGNQLYYVTFPRSDVGKAAASMPGVRELMQEPSGLIRVVLVENEALHADIWYYIDSRGRVQAVVPNDHYILARDKLVSQHVLSPHSWEEHNRFLMDSVRYWTGAGWVSEGELQR